MPWADYLTAVKSGWLEKIDYGIFKPEELSGLTDSDRLEYGVAAVYAAYGLAYSTKKYPEGTPRPTSYADLWDVKKFPATRTLRVGSYGSGPWEEALLADGVPADKLYPLDIDRAFRSLDRIKPFITKWWKEGAEGQQLFADGTIDVGQVFAGRIMSIRAKGAPVAIEWNQAKIQVDYWVIPKGAHNIEAAQRFIEFATRAKPQAAWAELFPNAPSNKNALRFMKPELAKTLPTDPENARKAFVRDDSWYVATGPGGKSNLEILIERWNKWVLQ
jgi:putative spermidine/putrescine transport system substrate-binding protein